MAGTGVRVDHTTTSGTFSLDGQTFDVDNNVWVVGDDEECVVIDAPHDVAPILDLVGGRRVRAILCTHAHDDHVRVAPRLREQTGAPILLHPDDKPVWELTHPDELWDVDLADGQEVEVAGTRLTVLHTPGHAPGAVCFHAPDLGCVFTGTPCSRAVRARPGGPSATTTRSSRRSVRGCSRCRPTRSCTPGTATTPRSVRSGRRSGPSRPGPAPSTCGRGGVRDARGRPASPSPPRRRAS